MNVYRDFVLLLCFLRCGEYLNETERFHQRGEVGETVRMTKAHLKRFASGGGLWPTQRAVEKGGNRHRFIQLM